MSEKFQPVIYDKPKKQKRKAEGVKCHECAHVKRTRDGRYLCGNNPLNKNHPINPPSLYIFDSCEKHNPDGQCEEYVSSAWGTCIGFLVLLAFMVGLFLMCFYLHNIYAPI
jgi:hypothetical protein